MGSIKHIEFWTSDLTKTMKFYEGLLGILHWERSGSNGFKRDGTKLYFKQRDRAKFGETIGPRHICFSALDRSVVDEVGKYLSSSQATIIRGPIEVMEEKYSPGYYTVDFRDPDGYILEVAHSPNAPT